MRPPKDSKTRVREIGIYAAAALFLSIVGPFNATPGFPAWAVFLYWFLLIFLGSLSAELAGRGLERVLPDLPLPVHLALLSVAAALAVTCVVFGFETLIMQRQIPLSYAPRIFGLVWVISAAMTGVGYMADKSILAPPPADAPEGAGPVETFLSRLPLKYRLAELHAVSSEDHYLRVHTSVGDELILMRLADAVRELEGAGGLQVHRSWWVAKAAVRDTARAGGKLTLVLISGKEVPVSRTYLPAVREAGLAA
jgi:hypothetical protein